MKKIEVLYKEFQHLYADLFNVFYLEKCNDKIEVIYTKFGDKPYFVNHKVDMIYIGSVSDDMIPIIIDELMPYKKKIKELIDNNTLFLITGNALEIFGKYILEDNKKIECLECFNYHIEKDMKDKHISWFKGKYKDMTIIGHKNQYSKLYEKKLDFIDTKEGYSSNYETSNEGIHYKKFYATYLLGPLCILNPYFTKYILKELGLSDKLYLENDIIEAYNIRLKDMEKMDTYYISEKM